MLIGGTACSILMDKIGAPFRVTKDLDVVLILEVLDSGFTKAFWKFIEEGRYEHPNKRQANEPRPKSCSRTIFFMGATIKPEYILQEISCPMCGRRSTMQESIV